MRNFILIIALISFVHCLSQESYHFSFDRSDFSITLKADTAIIQPNTNYQYSGSNSYPELPYIVKNILNPINQVVTDFDVTMTRELLASNVVMCCAEKDSLGLPIVYNGVLTPPVRHLGNLTQHGYSFSSWLISPIVYDGVTKKLYLVTNISISPSRSYNGNFTSGFVKPDRVDTSQFLNLGAMRSYSTLNQPETDGNNLEPIDYAIITVDSLASSFDELVRWKNMRGVRTSVFTIEHIYDATPNSLTNAEKIRYFLKELYLNRDLKYCTLGGDNWIIPFVKYLIYKGKTQNQEEWDEIPSDYFYACLEKGDKWWLPNIANARIAYGGNEPYEDIECLFNKIDITPEINIARLPIRTKKDAVAISQKIKSYESSPQTDLIKSVLLGGKKIREKYYDDSTSDADFEGQSTRFSLYNEWDGAIEFLFDTQNTLGYNNGAFTAQNLYNEINKGYNIVEINCHGYELSGWETLAGSYNAGDALQQQNGASTILLSTSCFINKFDSEYDPNLGEAFIRNPNGGALAVIGSTRNGKYIENSYNKLSVKADCEFLKDLLGNKSLKTPRLTKSLQQTKSFLINNLSGSYKMSYLYLLWAINLMGDAEMPVYTDVPIEITPIISSNGNNISVSVEDLPSDAVITLTDGLVNPNRMERYSGVNNVNFENLGEPYTIVISAYNRIPYIYTPYKYTNLHLHDRIIDKDITYRAQNIVIGENVTIKSGVKLTLISDNEIKMLSNVICESQAQLIFNHAN